jgi:hypothetical protein
MKKNYFLDNNLWIFIIIIVWIIIVFIYTYGTYFEKIITVKELDYIKYGRYGGNILTDSDNNVYTVHNSLLYGFFTSAELYTQFRANQKYKIKGYGYRIPILGRYRNIIGAERL